MRGPAPRTFLELLLAVSRMPGVRGSERSFLPEIQALRALAVGLVILFHLWPARITGGYVGVDVFFVISGYLITSHLLREVERTGHVGLAAFYARRMRRLLPASLLCLVVTGVIAIWLLPSQLARATAREVMASTVYVQNLWLASRAVTYSASNDVASPAQHYWSLSVEEQFYLVWPALVLLGIVLARRWLGGRTVLAVAAILGVVVAASFGHSILLTAADPAAAYFVTTTRAWEFGAGALAAIVLPRVGVGGAAAVGLRWTGAAAIVCSAFVLTQSTPFPAAVAAVPVLGTVAVIAAGDTGRRDPSLVVVGWRGVQWLGDVSYSAYLWHWPLIALGPFVLGHLLAWPEKLGVLVLTGLLAHASRTWVEQPFLSDRFRHASAWRTIGATFAVMALIVTGFAGWGRWSDQVEREQAQARLEQLANDPCMGALAVRNPGACAPAFATPLRAPVSEADSPWGMDECIDDVCWSGPRPAKVLALVGDSHAQTLYHALKPVAAAHGYGIRLHLLGACPANVVGTDQFQDDRREPEWCAGWARGLTAELRDAAPDLIVTSASTTSRWDDPVAAGRGYEKTWSEWTPIAPVVVLRDYPQTGGIWGPLCLASHADPLDCARPRAEALPTDVAYETARRGWPGVTAIDLSDLFCDAALCYPVVGGLPVYYDRDHITGTFGRSMAPVLAERLVLP